MRFLVPLAFTLVVAACGQTGDLYLPDQKPSPQTAQDDDAARKKEPAADLPPGR